MRRKFRINSLFVLRIPRAVIALGIFSFLLFVLPAQALQVTDRQSMNLDENLSDQGGNTYRPVETIALARISGPEDVNFGDSNAWIKGLYYYMITKMEFADIPFNYVVTWQGDVFEGKGGGSDVAPLAEGGDDSDMGRAVLIAYFGNNQEMTNSGRDAVRDLVSQLISVYDLSRGSVTAVDIAIAKKTQEVELSTLVLSRTMNADWQNFVGGISASAVYLPVDTVSTVSGEVSEVLYSDSVDAGKNFIVTAKIKNTGTVPWYNSGERKVLVATSDPRNRESLLYSSDSWASLTRVVESQEDWVLPGEVGTFQFEVRTPLIAKQYKELFELLMLTDRWIPGTQFTLDFAVTKGDFELVEILDTETGYLNVRDCPSTGCGEVGKVVPGEVVILREQDGAWLKIELESGKLGWIYARYAKRI